MSSLAARIPSELSAKKRPSTQRSGREPPSAKRGAVSKPSPLMGRLPLAPSSQHMSSSGQSAERQRVREPQTHREQKGTAEQPSVLEPPAPPDLLAEALGAAPVPVRNASAALIDEPSPTAHGQHVRSVPRDWGLKSSCLVTSASSLAWSCLPPPTTPNDALRPMYATLLDSHAAMSNASGGAHRRSDGADQAVDLEIIYANLATQLQLALTHWRHPLNRLPPAVSKLLYSPTGPSEEAFAAALREQWEAALRSLYFDLRYGRCAYFYCRLEAFTLLWHNPALETHAGDPWGYISRSSIRKCLAVLAPSTRGLRMQLRAGRVPFSMPAARADVGAQPSPQAARTLSEAERVNSGKVRDTAREEAVEAELVTLDGKPSSALHFEADALNALLDFFLNAKTPYHLSMQLLSPQQFLHGAPVAPRWKFRPDLRSGGSRERAAGGAAVGACAKAPGRTEADATLHAISIDASDRAGGPLLPCAVEKLTQLLRESQRRGFIMETRGEGRYGGWLNLPISVKAEETTVLPQPLADAEREMNSAEDRGKREKDIIRLGVLVESVACEAGELFVKPSNGIA